MRTVFVVGAGASLDFGFPLGSGLVDRIRTTISEELLGGSLGTVGKLREAAARAGYIDDFEDAAREIAGGLVVSRSIDRFLHSRRDREVVVKVGKNAISLAISQYEAESFLKFSRFRWENAQAAMLNANSTWLGRLFSILQEGKRPEEASTVFENVSFVTFNYDRVIERYLRLAFAHSFDQTSEEADRLVNSIPIYHVYGSLGDVSEHGIGNRLDFGPQDGEGPFDLDAISSRIRTFTESRDEETLYRCHQEIRSATNIVFLGFGFDTLNLEALFPEPLDGSQTYMGTKVGVGPKEEAAISNYIGAAHATNRLHSQSCPDYVGSHEFRGLMNG